MLATGAAGTPAGALAAAASPSFSVERDSSSTLGAEADAEVVRTDERADVKLEQPSDQG